MAHESTCPKNKLCSFESITNFPRGQKETCVFCGRTVVWKTDISGRMDNKKYLRFHLRDFCQPFGPTKKEFIQIYGKEHYEKSITLLKRERKVDWNKAQDEAEMQLREMRRERVVK